MSTVDLERPAVLRARDLLTGDLGTVPDTASVSDARAMMRHLEVRHVPVLGASGLVGMLHEAALPDSDGPVLDHVVRDVPRVRPNDGLVHLAALLTSSACGAVAVVDEAQHLLGVITHQDLDDALLRSA